MGGSTQTGVAASWLLYRFRIGSDLHEVVFQLLSWAKADALPAPLVLDGHIREGKHAGSTPLIMALQIQDRDLVAALLEARANT